MGMQNSKYLVAGYPFEGNANDIKGVNNGSVFGATFVDGKIGKAASFDGVDDNINYGDVFDLGLESRTVSFWLNIHSHQGAGAYGILGKTKYAGGEGRWFIYGEGYYIYFAIQAEPIYVHTITIPKSSLIINNWYFISWVINRTERMYLYINCQLIASLDISSFATIDLQTDLPFRIGAYSNPVPPYSATLFMDGLIDSVKIYNKALTQQEIQRDYLNLPIL